jgi:hypothetical protein
MLRSTNSHLGIYHLVLTVFAKVLEGLSHEMDLAFDDL